MSTPACLEVVEPGPMATVQDAGRSGLAALGVGRSGAADRRSLALANRLVGNPEGCAGVEITFGGLLARFTAPATIALTGALCPVHLGGRAVDMLSRLYLRAGDELRVGRPASGLRTYLAVRGGIRVPTVLGARATDTLAGIGAPPLSAGSALPIGPAAGELPAADFVIQASYDQEPLLHVIPGPRDDWFDDDAMSILCSSPYEVTADCNRIGIRLRGPALARRHRRELPPEATVPGALQVPPSAQPILFLADHPVTGGYPVIAVVHTDDLHLVAQARPGQRLRFAIHKRDQVISHQRNRMRQPSASATSH
jgi:biotin-dependent carboxylase-like uncharacterized protein